MNAPRHSKDQWRAITKDFEGGSLSQEEFAEARGLKLGTFRSRLYELRKAAAPPRFIEFERTIPAKASAQRPPVTLIVGKTRIEFSERPSANFLLNFIEGLSKDGS